MCDRCQQPSGRVMSSRRRPCGWTLRARRETRLSHPDLVRNFRESGGQDSTHSRRRRRCNRTRGYRGSNCCRCIHRNLEDLQHRDSRLGFSGTCFLHRSFPAQQKPFAVHLARCLGTAGCAMDHHVLAERPTGQFPTYSGTACASGAAHGTVTAGHKRCSGLLDLKG